jgi:hypothetical protein
MTRWVTRSSFGTNSSRTILEIDRGVARTHVRDPAEMIADRDDVARLDRLVG